MTDSASSPTDGELAPLTYRFATAADASNIVALTESAYRGEASRAGWTTEADLLDGRRTGLDEMQTLLDSEDAHLLLAFAGDDLVACAKLEQQGTHTYFGMFSVDPQRQGQGLGRVVLAKAESVAAQEFGATHVRMEVIVQRSELIAWYERRGYRRTGERTPFPYGDERFGIPKRDDLAFEWLEKAL